MVLETFTSFQRYITALILVIATALWYKIRSEKDLSNLKARRIFDITLLMTIPFIIQLIHFIPKAITDLLQPVIFFFIVFAVSILSIREYKREISSRIKDLENYSKNQKNTQYDLSSHDILLHQNS